MSDEILTGGYDRLAAGSFEQRGAMPEIVARLRRMQLLNPGEPPPTFYFNAADGSYWELNEFDDQHNVELRRVDRDVISDRYPTP